MRPASVRVRLATPDELARCHAVRREVFVEEQGVPIDEEMDAHDGAATHFLALLGDQVVGTARLRATGNGSLKAERLAVRRPFRQRGAGRALMQALEAAARSRGRGDVVLNAQVAVVPFYERLGYTGEGPEFIEAGIPHRAMRKRVS